MVHDRKLKVIYFTSTSFLDSDLPLLNELEELTVVRVLIDLPKHGLKSPILNLANQPLKPGIFPLHEIVLDKDILAKFPKSTYVINRPKSKLLSWEMLRVNLLLYLFILKSKADFLHFINPPQFHAWSIYLFKKKKVLTIHDPISHIGESKRNKFFKNISLRLIKHIILLNNTQREEFERIYKINPARITITGLSILNEFQLKWNEAPTNDILFFGRFTPYKGLMILNNAINIIENRQSNIRFIVAGSGKLPDEWINSPNLHLINRHIPLDELKVLIAQSKIVVCPYIEATQSGVVMAAFAQNKPVIATDVGALSEMIQHQETGLIIKPNNPELLADAIEGLCNNLELQAHMQKNIDRLFKLDGISSWKSIAQKTLRCYSE